MHRCTCSHTIYYTCRSTHIYIYTYTYKRTRNKSKHPPEISLGWMITVESTQVENVSRCTRSTHFYKNISIFLNVKGCEPECIHFPKKSLWTSSGCFSEVTSTTNVALLFTPDTGRIQQTRLQSMFRSNSSFNIDSAEYLGGGASKASGWSSFLSCREVLSASKTENN